MEKVKLDLADKRNAEISKNVTALIGIIAMNVGLAIAYWVEVIKDTRTLASYLIVAILCILPTVLSYVEYRRKKDSAFVRYIASIGFMLLYTYVMFTTSTDLAFCYILVFFVIMTVYSDVKLSVILAAYALVLNVIIIVKKLLAGSLTDTTLTNAVIIIACVSFTCLFAILANRKIAQISQASYNKAEEDKKQSQQLLQDVLKVSVAITENIGAAVSETEQLEESIVLTQQAMENLVDGTTDTVNAIVGQKESTDKIDIHIHEVEEAVDSIMLQIRDVEKNLEVGNVVMKDLLQQVQISETSGELVADKVKELGEYASNMQDIMELISKVAYQTGMLALNASIEAARAGEAGRGFAVVASQISNLAAQTKSATADINQIIADISQSVTSVTEAMNTLLESSRMQNKYVDDTAGSIEKIYGNTREIAEQAEQLDKIVDIVVDANTQVTERIENVSALTEEVTASANETLESSNVNLDSIKKVSDIMAKLGEEAKELQSTYDI